MHIVLLSGGSGKRLWPLSNDIRSKQFIKIFKSEGGSFESMVQRVYHQIKRVDSDASIIIATSKNQVSAIHNQLGNNVRLSIEPCRRDTFPAIALATTYLHDVCNVNEDETIVVCPVDPFVDDSFFDTIYKMAKQVEKKESNLVLIGIQPTYASDKYGYILPKSSDTITPVDSFKEKPSCDIAQEYLMRGALWNSGVFAFRLGYMRDKALELLGRNSYLELSNNYTKLKSISFDYAVVEREKKIQVIRYVGEWKDIGTWNTLTETMSERVIGNGILDDTCENVHILNELDLPILAMGLKNVVISASPDGILVSDKIQSGYMKKYVDVINQESKFVEKSWGDYRVIALDHNSLTAKIMIKAGCSMSYHSHEKRREIWTVTSGTGIIVIDGKGKEVVTGDVIPINIGCRHTIIAETDLRIIETQLGEEISVQDKTKYELDMKSFLVNAK